MTTLHRHGDLIRDRYQIHALIGQGGTGETYRAEDMQQHQWVALKVMSLKQLGNFDLLDRFEREATILGTIDHPGVPDYVEHFRIETEDDCRFYLAQEFASGKSLDRWVQEGWRATEAEVQRIANEVLTTLEYLHGLENPIIHRDIKPQNIIRQSDGRIYLVDFGAVQSAYRDQQATQGTFIGTLGYMPPEQLRGQATFASDLYALGATLVFLLTHRNPDELPMQRMKIHFQGRVKLSEAFAAWLDRMLEPRLKTRFASAKAARMGLQQLSESAELAELDELKAAGQPQIKQALQPSAPETCAHRLRPSWLSALLYAINQNQQFKGILLYLDFGLGLATRLLMRSLGPLSIPLIAWFLDYAFDRKLKYWVLPLAIAFWWINSIYLNLSLVLNFVLFIAVERYLIHKHEKALRLRRIRRLATALHTRGIGSRGVGPSECHPAIPAKVEQSEADLGGNDLLC